MEGQRKKKIRLGMKELASSSQDSYDRGRDILIPNSYPSSDYQTIEAMDAKELQLPPEPHAG